MNLYIKANLSQTHYLNKTKKVINALSNIDSLTCILDDEDYKKLYKKDNPTKLSIKDADLIVSIGGDGTLLNAGKLALKHNLPIVGINAGRVGYLCKYSIDDILKVKTNPFKDLKVKKKAILSLTYHGKQYYAINDFIFASKNVGYSVTPSVKIRDKEITYRSSGVIIATSIGSSAYNKSAGGSLIDENLKAFIITPLSPCGKEKASLVISDDEEITIKNTRIQDPIEICVDGVTIGDLDSEIEITKAKKYLKIM